MSDSEKLRKVNLLGFLDDEELSAFSEVCRKSVASQRDVIFNENDRGDSLYLLTSGRVQISKRIVENQEEILFVVFDGDIFGEMAFVDATPRSSTATALDDCELYVINKHDFDQLLDDRHEMALKISRQLSRVLTSRLRATNEKVKEHIKWNLEISGASSLGIQYLISSKADIEIELSNGRKLSGHILLVADTETGWQVNVKEQNGRFFIIPYGAINTISIAESDLGKAIHASD